MDGGVKIVKEAYPNSISSINLKSVLRMTSTLRNDKVVLDCETYSTLRRYSHFEKSVSEGTYPDVLGIDIGCKTFT